MTSLYSKGCEYALRALVEIAAERAPGNVRAQDICRKSGVPEAYARKTFQALVQNGFLKAVSGPGGGYSLVGDPREITALDVIEAVEGRKNFSRCVLGFPTCNDRVPCSLHHMWMNLRGKIMQAFASQSLSELARSKRSPNNKKGKRR